MHFVRRSRAVGALAAFVAAYGAVLGRPIGLAGAALIGAWLVGRQYAFVATLSTVSAALSVGQPPERTSVETNETGRVYLEAAIDPGRLPDACRLSVAAGLPTAARADEPLVVSLEPGDERATAATDVTWPVPGHHQFDPVHIDVDDGWFRGTLTVGDRPTVTVEPKRPREIHVGAGGQRFTLGTGSHETSTRGPGIEPAEIREYTAGDDARRIDWKATARFDRLHVRDSPAEADRRTAIVVDARDSLTVGPRDATPLAHLVDVALAVAASARRAGDPIGLVTVGDAGIRTRIPVSAATETGVKVRRTLLDLEAVGARASVTGPGDEADRDGRATTAADARDASATLDGGDAFSRTLAPFYADRAAYVERVEAEPLFAAVDEFLTRETASPWTVILTDDADRAELRETVANARSRGSEVLVVAAPRVLSEPDALVDPERAYERYADFDAFRRRLARQPGVTALEVGPADRLATVLETGRSRAQTRPQSDDRSPAGDRR